MTNITQNRELVLTKTLNAPIDAVWQAWILPDRIAQWWGPDGFTNTIIAMDMTPGGEWNLIMHGPDGTDYRNESVFKEIVLHKKIVYDHLSAPKFLATIEFEAQGAQTLIKWHMLFETPEQFTQVVKVFKADEGLQQILVKLNAYVTQE